MKIFVNGPRAINFLWQKGINDDKLVLLGLHKDQVLKKLGKPTKSRSGGLEYKFQVSGNRALLSFDCYKFWQYQCRTISVHWFY